MRRLAVVAESSLLIDAIALGLRQSGEFILVGRDDQTAPADVESICAERPDAVLVDDMEGGPEALEFIHQLCTCAKATPVVLLTMNMERDWLQAVFAAGAAGAIAKTTNPAVLSTLLRETIAGRVLNLQRSLGGSQATSADPPIDSPLTQRELEVLRLLAGGSTNCEIARQLWITEQTVKFHLSNVYRKLGVANRTEASHHAHVTGLVAPTEPAEAS